MFIKSLKLNDGNITTDTKIYRQFYKQITCSKSNSIITCEFGRNKISLQTF